MLFLYVFTMNYAQRQSYLCKHNRTGLYGQRISLRVNASVMSTLDKPPSLYTSEAAVFQAKLKWEIVRVVSIMCQKNAESVVEVVLHVT